MGDRYIDGYELLNANIKTNVGMTNLELAPVTANGLIPAGAAPYVSVKETGNGIMHQTIFTLSALPVTMRDTEQGGGIQIYQFPKGRILFLGGSGQFTPTTTTAIATTLLAGKTCNWGVGTVTQANATLATTEQDLIQVAAFVSSATINVAAAASTASKGVASVTPYAGVSTPTAAFFNLAVNGAADIDGNAIVTANGTLTLTWINLGLL